MRPNEVAKAASTTRQVTDWGWEAYNNDLHLPMHRIALAKRIVDGLTAAIEAGQRPWQVKFRKGYVAFQRAGGYNVMVVDLVRNRPVRLAIKLPSGQDPDSPELMNLLPQLPVVWDASTHEWGWQIQSAEDIPDPEFVVGVADRYAAGTSDESLEEG